jgi:mono/diheme cytochrome c family protein
VNVRIVLIVLNAVVLVGLATYAVLALRRSPEVKEPDNLTPFLDDEDLEGRRLDRVLGWALLFAAVIAVALPVYWLREPDRQAEAEDYFDEGAVERGEILFANASSEVFDSAKSLQCANCHGVDGSGGAAQYIYTGADGQPQRLAWSAPALNTVLLRFSEEEVRQIITYGRPGTPMQAWGLAGGGPKNEQSINDLLAYLASIQLTPEEAQAEARAALTETRKAAREQVVTAEAALEEAQTALDEAETTLDETRTDPEATDRDVRDAERAVDRAERVLADAEEALAWAEQWAAARADVTDGQLLFELYCARCHTQGWSIFDPARADPGTAVLGPSGGGGTVGFNLRDGQSIRRFGSGEEGFADQVDFVTNGSEANKGYGNGGIGSGRMPGFGQMLPPEYIEMIVAYERGEDADGNPVPGLDDTTYPGVGDGE